MTAQGGDILAWLENAITKAESDADRWHDAECSFHETTLIDTTVLQGGATLCDCGGPTVVRRRCAADRKLLALHEPMEDPNIVGRDHLHCQTCAAPVIGELDSVPFPCTTVRALAEGYGWTGGER